MNKIVSFLGFVLASTLIWANPEPIQLNSLDQYQDKQHQVSVADSNGIPFKIKQLRLKMFQALQGNQFARYDSLWIQAHQDFNSMVALHNTEDALSALLLGHYDWLRDSIPQTLINYRLKSNMNRVFLVYNTYNALQFCPQFAPPKSYLKSGESVPEDSDGLEWELVRAFNSNGGLAKMTKEAPDLADLVRISLCDRFGDAEFNSQDQKAQIISWIKNNPSSRLRTSLNQTYNREYIPTGAGFLISGGPSGQVFDSKTNHIIPNGLSGGFAIDLMFSEMTASLQTDFRTFTAQSGFPIKDTFATKGLNYSFSNVDFLFGHNFVLNKNLIFRPYIGLSITEISMDDTSSSNGSMNLWGPSYPVGCSLDWILRPVDSDVSFVYGLRLWTTYRITEIGLYNSNFGDSYLSAGISFTMGFLGYNRQVGRMP